MATATPKVKFKPLYNPASPAYAPPSFTEQMLKVEDSPPSAPWVSTESVNDKFNVFILCLLKTTSHENASKNYSYHAQEAAPANEVEARISAYKDFAENQVECGAFTGYILKVFRINPMISSTSMAMIFHHKKFQVKKKTFLNGPLKDNEFLSGKGKHYG